jgi:hypothetical protein
MNTASEKPTLMQLRRSYNQNAQTPITSQHLAQVAQVSLSDEFLVELGRPVDAMVVNRVIGAFSTLTGQHYTLADIEVRFKDSASDGQSEYHTSRRGEKSKEGTQTACKLPFGTLCHMNNVNALMLARASKVHVLDIWVMISGSATRENADRVLRAFNALTGTSYTLNDIQVNLIEEGNAI